jgi:hypothetical protein
MVTIVTNTVRCVQEAEDGTARTFLQTLTLPSEDADILKWRRSRSRMIRSLSTRDSSTAAAKENSMATAQDRLSS